MRCHRLVAACGLAAVCTLAPSAQAQVSGNFSVNHFNPSERGSEWFVLDSLDLRGHVRPAAGIIGDWAVRPLVVYNGDGSLQSSVVRNQATVHAGASLVLWERVRFGVDAPVQVFSDGELGELGGGVVLLPPAHSTALGDLRLSADVRLFGVHGAPFTVAAGASLWIPTGDPKSYSGDSSARVAPRVIVAGEIGSFVYGGSLGAMYRENDGFGDRAVGTVVMLGASAGLRLFDRKLVIGPELFGDTVVSTSDSTFSKRATPFEGLLGAHYTFADALRVGAGVGTGLARGYGAPTFRGVLSVEWTPGLQREPDPLAPAAISSEPPKVEPVEVVAPPPAPEPIAPVVVAPVPPAIDGDRDKDGIPNEADACPDDAGAADSDPKHNGCPKAFVKDGQIKIQEQVKFGHASGVLLPTKENQDVLEAVAAILKQHPEIKGLRIEGYSDSVGSAESNTNLSKRRAAAVLKWLAGHGVDPKMLQSVGLGSESPIDSNETTAGRANNRRVEFHILDSAPGAAIVKESKP